MKREFDCIVCPMSCHMEATDERGELSIQGNSCPRGAAFVKQELTCPMRMLTTTIRIHQALHPLLPVITSQIIAKDKISDIIALCKELEVEAPVLAGQVIVHDIANSGADLIASRSFQKNDATENLASHQ